MRKNYKKKILASLFLLIIILLQLTGCTNNSNEKSSEDKLVMKEITEMSFYKVALENSLKLDKENINKDTGVINSYSATYYNKTTNNDDYNMNNQKTPGYKIKYMCFLTKQEASSTYVQSVFDSNTFVVSEKGYRNYNTVASSDQSETNPPIENNNVVVTNQIGENFQHCNITYPNYGDDYYCYTEAYCIDCTIGILEIYDKSLEEEAKNIFNTMIEYVPEQTITIPLEENN